MKLVGANRWPRMTGLDLLLGKSNYFISKNSANWHRDVPEYAKVKIEDVYPGIDLVYYGNQRQLEYDWIVAPGADPGAIRFAVENTDKLEIDVQGNLKLDGTGELRLRKPVVYQERDGIRREIPSGYVARGDKQFGFHVEEYDDSLPLVIDPVLIYSTYLGGSAFDSAYGIAVDSAGNAYVIGTTSSANFPTQDAFKANYGGGPYDVFVTKLNPSGNALVYSTYLGGSSDDNGYGIAVDSAGNAYVTGATSSTNFPTVNPFQANNGGGSYDAFVTKLNPSGDALVYSTYLGGRDDDFGYGHCHRLHR